MPFYKIFTYFIRTLWTCFANVTYTVVITIFRYVFVLIMMCIMQRNLTFKCQNMWKLLVFILNFCVLLMDDNNNRLDSPGWTSWSRYSYTMLRTLEKKILQCKFTFIALADFLDSINYELKICIYAHVWKNRLTLQSSTLSLSRFYHL